MNLFLVVYERKTGRLVSIDEFATADRAIAEQRRLQLELEAASQGLRREIVILEAASEGALRLTHGRYFKDLKELRDLVAH